MKDKTDNTFHNKDGEQNVAQGERPIGKQVNNYLLQPLKPRTVVIVFVLAVGLLAGSGLRRNLC